MMYWWRRSNSDLFVTIMSYHYYNLNLHSALCASRTQNNENNNKKVLAIFILLVIQSIMKTIIRNISNIYTSSNRV